jgi:hypothetical protein
VADHDKHMNEPSGSIKDSEVLDQLSNCLLLKKDSGLWSYLVGINCVKEHRNWTVGLSVSSLLFYHDPHILSHKYR